MSDITKLSVLELIKEQKHGLTIEDIFLAYRDKAVNDKNNAFITVLKHADISCQEDAPLLGIPYAAKDNICTKGIPTTCASKMLEHHIPLFDATAVTRLKKAGAVLLGKTNMDEFGMGSTTENSIFGAVRNPLNPQYTAGGSSGGSAAAVAACQAAFALGSDTGGSVRLPASYCSVVGMKPTYGRVSRNGLIAFASSLDQIGPITRTVRDNALILDCICGADPMDSTSVPHISDCSSEIGKDIKGMRFALPDEMVQASMDPEVKAALDKAVRTVTELGGEICRVKLPCLERALWAYYIMSSAEASSNLARYDGVRYGHSSSSAQDLDGLYRQSRSEGFGQEVKRRILLGTHVLSTKHRLDHYKMALSIRTEVKNEMAAILKKNHCIISPVSPSVAQRLGQKSQNVTDIFSNDIFTVIANVAGLPAVSIPCSLDQNGVGIGVQLIGSPFDEKTLYRCAYALESSSGLTEAKK